MRVWNRCGPASSPPQNLSFSTSMMRCRPPNAPSCPSPHLPSCSHSRHPPPPHSLLLRTRVSASALAHHRRAAIWRPWTTRRRPRKLRRSRPIVRSSDQYMIPRSASSPLDATWTWMTRTPSPPAIIAALYRRGRPKSRPSWRSSRRTMRI